MSSMSGPKRLAAADEGAKHADVLEPVLLAGERVGVEHDHVGELARLQAFPCDAPRRR